MPSQKDAKITKEPKPVPPCYLYLITGGDNCSRRSPQDGPFLPDGVWRNIEEYALEYICITPRPRTLFRFNIKFTYAPRMRETGIYTRFVPGPCFQCNKPAVWHKQLTERGEIYCYCQSCKQPRIKTNTDHEFIAYSACREKSGSSWTVFAPAHFGHEDCALVKKEDFCPCGHMQFRIMHTDTMFCVKCIEESHVARQREIRRRAKELRKEMALKST